MYHKSLFLYFCLLETDKMLHIIFGGLNLLVNGVGIQKMGYYGMSRKLWGVLYNFINIFFHSRNGRGQTGRYQVHTSCRKQEMRPFWQT